MKNLKTSLALCAMGFLIFNTLPMTASAVAMQTAAPAPSSGVVDPWPKIKEIMEKFYAARKAEDWGTCMELAQECEALGPEGKGIARQMRVSVYVHTKNDEAVKKLLNGSFGDFTGILDDFYGGLEKHPDWDGGRTLKMTDDAIKILEGQAMQLKLRKLQLLVKNDKPAEYLAFGNEIINGAEQNNAFLVNKVAWYIVCPDSGSAAETDICTRKTPDGKPITAISIATGEKGPFLDYTMLKHSQGFRSKEMLALAKKAIDQAIKLTERKNGDMLDTLGWTYFRLGDKVKAAATEKEASEKAGNNEVYKRVAEWFAKS